MWRHAYHLPKTEAMNIKTVMPVSGVLKGIVQLFNSF